MEPDNNLIKITIEEIKALQEQASTHITMFLQRARDEAGVILDSNGQLSKESVTKLRDIVNKHLAENAAYPTILEHLDNPKLRDTFDIKATFNVAGIYGTTVIRPFKEHFKIDADWNLLATFFLMSFFSDDQDKSLFEKFSEILNFKGILSEESRNKEISKIVVLLMRALEQVDLIKVDDVEGQFQSSITIAGANVLKHLVALDTITNIMQVQLMQIAMDNKNNQTKEDSEESLD